MALLWHIVGFEQPLAGELAEISRQQDANFLRRQLSRDDTDTDSAPPPGRSLQSRRADVEREIRALRHEKAASQQGTHDRELVELIERKRRAIAQLQHELAALESARRPNNASKKSATNLLEDQLRRQRHDASEKQSDSA